MRWLARLTKRFSFPGFEGVSIYNVVTFFFNEIRKEDITVRSSALAFNFFLALFPAILFFFTLIAYIPIKNLQTDILSTLTQVMPDEVFKTIQTTVVDIVKRQRGDLLSLGFLSALFFALNGIKSLMNSFDKSHPGFKKRNFFKKHFIALQLTLLISFLILISVILIISGNLLIKWVIHLFHFKKSALIALTILRWVIIVAMFFTGISVLYYYGPAVKRKWKFISAGSTLATVLSILTSLGFSYFVNNFGQYNKLYGSIGTVMVLMLWFYFNSLVLLIGFELNASIEVNKIKALKRRNEAKRNEEMK